MKSKIGCLLEFIVVIVGIPWLILLNREFKKPPINGTYRMLAEKPAECFCYEFHFKNDPQGRKYQDCDTILVNTYADYLNIKEIPCSDVEPL